MPHNFCMIESPFIIYVTKSLFNSAKSASACYQICKSDWKAYSCELLLKKCPLAEI